ncbi:hypothetical protein [Adhaeribacter pallidiroseus]|uniref:Uncharacterized protein n=1 Tax=Adhaeribacter pallidiroseus TaxID=2072847 RepID=A0A369QQR5_9BACT|nr:hypothetical protein [Adhaeribacter pallidiroseus]RDC66025.1 hypothetical protein AHMF7616_04656 [Adhaeribacter pallidiroseus]
MRRNSIRILFVVVSVFLVIQLMYIWKFSEPYPAIRFPGFGKIPQVGGEVSFTKYEVVAYASQDSVTVKPEELFDNIPKHYLPNLLNNLIKKRTEDSQPNATISTKKRQDYEDFKIYIANRLNILYNKKYDKLVINKFDVKRNPELSDSVGRKSLIETAGIILH